MPSKTGSPPVAAKNKRKERDEGLGIEEQLDVKKLAREPRVRLDEDRLLSDNGIVKMYGIAEELGLKGKGHELSDIRRILSAHQQWLDDLYPKAKFEDALAMVEKAGHGAGIRRLRIERMKPPAREEEGNEERNDGGNEGGNEGDDEQRLGEQPDKQPSLFLTDMEEDLY